MTSDGKEKFEHQDFLSLTPNDRAGIAKALAHQLMDAGVGILEEKVIPEKNSIQIGDYTIVRPTIGGSFWIHNASISEEIKITPEKLEKLIADFYYEES